jgi:exonuclease SbcC
LQADHVSQDDIDAAEQESGRLRRAAEAARTQLQAQQAMLIELQVVADQLNPTQAQAKVDELTTSVEAAREAVRRLPALTGAVAALEAEAEQLTDGVREATRAQAARTQQLADIDARIAADTAAIEQARLGFASVAERIAWLQDGVRALDAAARAVDELAAAEQQSRRAQRRLASALQQAGFADVEQWRGACRSDADMARAESELAAFDADCAAVAEQLQDPALHTADLDGEPPDLTPLRSRLAIAADTEMATAGALGAARQRLTEASAQAATLARTEQECADVLLTTAPAIRLGALAAGLGDNQLKMELTTYILIRRFTDVVSAANAQLRLVSGGRYELEHTAERSGNARSGLGLRVLDLRTGRSRDPGTLSGGETFYVALSLALGLADVVRAESGGVDLGTLFIDEGFGSLDAEVLDEVLSVLDSLRAGGRTVGVVSHVAEMKARIADRIEVRPNADGSSRLQVLA